MDAEIFAEWSALPVETRRQAVAIREPLLDALQSALRHLLKPEVGQKGPEFDKTRLVLTNSMVFDRPGKEVSAILWPSRLHADPAHLVNVVTETLGADFPWRALPEQLWADIVVPAPTEWLNFERSLARLMQQLILHAVPLARQRISWAAMSSPALTASPSSGQPSPPPMDLDDLGEAASEAKVDGQDAGSAGEADVAAADADADAEHGGAEAFSRDLTARQEKRLRQRERRKLGRRAMAQGLPRTTVEADALIAGGALAAAPVMQRPLDPAAEPFVMPSQPVVAAAAAQLAATPAPGVAPAPAPAVAAVSSAAPPPEAAKPVAIASGPPPAEALAVSQESVSTMVGSSSHSGSGGSSRATTRSPGSDAKRLTGGDAGREPAPAPPAADRHLPGVRRRSAAEAEAAPAALLGAARESGLLDGVQARLEQALAALDGERPEECREQLREALGLCTGLGPYLERVNRPMSRHWEHARQAAAPRPPEPQADGGGDGGKELAQAAAPAAMTMRTLQFLCHTLRASHAMHVGSGSAAATAAAALGLAEALPPQGRVIALEADHSTAELVRRGLVDSSSAAKVSLHCARDTLQWLDTLPFRGEAGFHLIFLGGGGGAHCAACLERILERDLLAPGGILAIDGVLRQGTVYTEAKLDADSSEAAKELATLSQQLLADRRLEPVILPIQNGLALVRRLPAGDALGDSRFSLGQPAKVESLDTDFEGALQSSRSACGSEDSLVARAPPGARRGLDALGIWTREQAPLNVADMRRTERAMSWSSEASAAAAGLRWPPTPDVSPLMRRPSAPW